MLFNKRKQDDFDRHAEDVRKALSEWQEAKRYFENVSDPDLVEYAVYQVEAARRRYVLMLRRYAAEEAYFQQE